MININYCDFDVKKESKKISTLKYLRQYKNKWVKWADRFTTSGADNDLIVLSLLVSLYGKNIGEQIKSHISAQQIDKIRKNCIKVAYYD